MRIAVFVAFILVLNKTIAQTSSSSQTLPISAFNCEELTSRVQALKESTRSKKDKFSCILNLLKSALTDELEPLQCQEEIENLKTFKNELEEKVSDDHQKVKENESERENTNGINREFYEKLVTKTTPDEIKKIKNNTHLEVPTMIPIFKQRPIRKDFENQNHARPRSIPVAAEAIHTNPNPIINSPKFTIPCQRAADVLDMSVALPRKAKKHMKTVQQNVNPTPPPNHAVSPNQSPATVSVHCEESDDSVAIMFKPKTISLIQLYGNLLKKITITVLVPYHMSKMGQQ